MCGVVLSCDLPEVDRGLFPLSLFVVSELRSAAQRMSDEWSLAIMRCEVHALSKVTPGILDFGARVLPSHVPGRRSRLGWKMCLLAPRLPEAWFRPRWR